VTDEDFGRTVDAINDYHLRRRQESLGMRTRWREIRTGLARGLRGSKDTDDGPTFVPQHWVDSRTADDEH
jgi:hypothetical protein